MTLLYLILDVVSESMTIVNNIGKYTFPTRKLRVIISDTITEKSV